MAMHAAMPSNATSCGTVITFIVPLVEDCNLRCPFCYIKQRDEITNKSFLEIEYYRQFVIDSFLQINVSNICIQGHECLLPSSIGYTLALLDIGNTFDLPVSIITNGTYLSDSAIELAKRRPARIAVSLDSHVAEQHDRQRGVPGTFEKVVEGLRQAGTFPELQNVVDVTSVLIPKKRKQLFGMPALLAEIGIKRWTVNALFKVGKGDVMGGPVGDHARTFQDLLILQREAEKHGIEMTVDDEFGRLSEEDMNRDVVDINQLRIHRLQRPSGVFRLMPDGRCSIGTELLQEVTDDTPRWIPGEEHAADFLQRVRERYAAKQAAQAAA